MRYYIVDIIGNGTEDDPYRPNIPDQAMQKWSLAASIATDINGVPTESSALVEVSQWADENTETELNFDLVDAIPSNLKFPFDLDLTAPPGFKTSVIARVNPKGLNLDAAVTTKDVLRAVGKLYQPDFNKFETV